jgi:hypothetical protein
MSVLWCRQFALFFDIDFHNDNKYEASRAGESCMPVRAEASGVDKPDEKSSGKIGIANENELARKRAKARSDR